MKLYPTKCVTFLISSIRNIRLYSRTQIRPNKPKAYLSSKGIKTQLSNIENVKIHDIRAQNLMMNPQIYPLTYTAAFLLD